MASDEEKFPEEVANDNNYETASGDVTDSTEFPFVDGLTEVTFRIKNTRLHVNKGIVMIASPIFRKMLTSESNETLQNDVVLEKEVDSMTLLMKCIYPDRSVRYTDEVVDAVLPLASEYQIRPIIDRCEEGLLQKYFLKEGSSKPSFDRLMEFVNFGVMYGTRELEDRAAETLANWPSTKIENHPLYAEFPADDKVKILTARNKYIEKACSVAYDKCSSSLRSVNSWMQTNIDRNWNRTLSNKKMTVDFAFDDKRKILDVKSMHDSVEYLQNSLGILQECKPGRIFAA